MGKSYKQNDVHKKSHSENSEYGTSYKYRKNKLKERRIDEEYSEYKIHGIKNYED